MAGYETSQSTGWDGQEQTQFHPAIWHSPDFGRTWSGIWTQEWAGFCLSRDGKTLLVSSQGNLLRSSNLSTEGDIWFDPAINLYLAHLRTNRRHVGPGAPWTSIRVPSGLDGMRVNAASADLKTIVIEADSGLFITHNQGDSWRPIDWQGIQVQLTYQPILALSGDGQHLAVVANHPSVGGLITSTLLLSDDGGATWRQTAAPLSEGIEVFMGAVAISDDGQMVLASAVYTTRGPWNTAGPIVQSRDGGNTWSETVARRMDEGGPNFAEHMAMSADGSVQMAALTGVASVPVTFPPGSLLIYRNPFSPRLAHEFRQGQFEVLIMGSTGQTTILETSSELSQPVWTPVHTNILNGSLIRFTDPDATAGTARFYRLRVP